MKNLAITTILAVMLAAGGATAQEAGTYTLGIGLGNVAPKSNNGTLAGTLATTVGNNIRPTLTFEYFVYRNVGIEILAAAPFKHKVSLNGMHAADVKQLPPTVSLQYHFENGSPVTPFVGLGVNYTAVLKTSEMGPIAGQNLKLKNSWGWAAHAGVDVRIDDANAIRVDARYIDIKLDAELNGADIGTVKVDPIVWGVSWIHRF